MFVSGETVYASSHILVDIVHSIDVLCKVIRSNQHVRPANNVTINSDKAYLRRSRDVPNAYLYIQRERKWVNILNKLRTHYTNAPTTLPKRVYAFAK